MNKVLIYGGLGNQMFQYAFTLALNEKKIKTTIAVSTFFYNYFHNGFNLGKAFRLKLPFYQAVLVNILFNGGFLYKNKVSNEILRRLLVWYNEKMFRRFHEEREFEYNEEVFSQRSSLLIGTWQVEAYFKAYESEIRKAFQFKEPKDEKNKALIKDITNGQSVSIHVRRGDYLNSDWSKTHAVIQGTTYYENALAYLESNVSDAKYFVFSDDIQWVKDNLKLQNATYVDHNTGENSYLDMYLMSLCRHNIIANSTFSWWGAWLNSNPDKIVIMPEKWLNTNSCQGIFPEQWVKMSI